MSAYPYKALVDYNDDIAAALEKARKDVFEQGHFFGVENHPISIEAAIEASGDTGTRSILDINHISEEPEFFAASPLDADELRQYFHTGMAHLNIEKKIDSCIDFWDSLERGQARYIILHDKNNNPAKILFAGYSFD